MPPRMGAAQRAPRLKGYATVVSNPTDFLKHAGVSMLDLRLGDALLFETPVAFLLQTDLWEMVQHNGPAGMAVLAILICFSVYSWTIIFSKLGSLRGAGKANSRFLRAFRKASGMEAVMVASEQFRPSPLVAVFDFGYEELERQVKARGFGLALQFLVAEIEDGHQGRGAE